MEWNFGVEPGLPVVDDEAMRRLQGLMADVSEEGEDLAKDLVDTFRADVEQRMQAFDVAVAASDFLGAGEAVHALKGASATVGAPRMAALCALLEEQVRARRSPEGASQRIRDEAEAAVTALAAALGQRRDD